MQIVVAASVLTSILSASAFDGRYGSLFVTSAAQTYRVTDWYAGVEVGAIDADYDYEGGGTTIKSEVNTTTAPVIGVISRLPVADVRLFADYQQDKARHKTAYARGAVDLVPAIESDVTDDTLGAGFAIPIAGRISLGGRYERELSVEVEGDVTSRLTVTRFSPSLAVWADDMEFSLAYEPPTNVRDGVVGRSRTSPTSVAARGEWLGEGWSGGLSLERSDHRSVDDEGRVTLDPGLFAMLWDGSGGFFGGGYSLISGAQADGYSGATHVFALELMKAVYEEVFVTAAAVRTATTGKRPIGGESMRLAGDASGFSAGVIWKR